MEWAREAWEWAACEACPGQEPSRPHQGAFLGRVHSHPHRDAWGHPGDRCHLQLPFPPCQHRPSSETITLLSSMPQTSHHLPPTETALPVDQKALSASVDHILRPCHLSSPLPVPLTSSRPCQARKSFCSDKLKDLDTNIANRHLLRKSGTFTGLDFAPPKRFKDNETMSDAGSIRSNRSGVSAMQLGAIRSGAYRVSRLPQGVVGTKDDLSTSLKPQWGMRVGS